MMERIAVIGSREPSDIQIARVRSFLDGLKKERLRSGAKLPVIKSGCAEGIDEIALEYAMILGFPTVGCIPKWNFRRHVHKFCNEIIDLDKADAELKQKAYESVKMYHPTGGKLKPFHFLLHARNYLIVRDVSLIFALPSNSRGFGGTGQGIRVGHALGTDCTVVMGNGMEFTASELLEQKPETTGASIQCDLF